MESCDYSLELAVIEALLGKPDEVIGNIGLGYRPGEFIDYGFGILVNRSTLVQLWFLHDPEHHAFRSFDKLISHISDPAWRREHRFPPLPLEGPEHE